MSKNKTQTISVSTLVKKVIIKFLLFSDLPSYFRFLLGSVLICIILL